MLDVIRDVFDEMFASRASFDTHVDVADLSEVRVSTPDGESVTLSARLRLITVVFQYDILINTFLRPGRPRIDLIEATALRRGNFDLRQDPIPLGSGPMSEAMIRDLFQKMFANELLSLWSPSRNIQLLHSEQTEAITNQPGYVHDAPKTRQ